MGAVTGRPGPEWSVRAPAAAADDLDARLRRPAGRTDLLQVVVDHDLPAAGRCPGCGWSSVSGRRDCPSRVVALALLDNTPLRSRLAHLADVVPGARVAREGAEERHARREAEDAVPGLFEAPARAPEPRRTQ